MTTNDFPAVLRDRYARHTPYSDPGRHRALLDALPHGVTGVRDVVQSLLVHYRSSGLDLPAERLPEIDLRWVEAILSRDQQRFGTPLAAERPWAERTAGCCRDFSLVTVSALRHQGIPARARIGFATYFEPDFHTDHVIVEYWEDGAWHWTDTQLGMPTVTPDQFHTAARAWTDYRAGSADPENYGVSASLPLRGAWFVRNYVLLELAHRFGDELLLWDAFGAGSSDELGDEVAVIDEVAGLLTAADDGDESADQKLAELYASDARLNPRGHVLCMSPTGRTTTIELAARTPNPL